MGWFDTQNVSYDTIATNLVGDGSGNIVLSNLDGYNTLIIIAKLANTNTANAPISWVVVSAYRGAGGVLISTDTFYQQGFSYTNNAGATGDTTQTVYPLNGANYVTLHLGTQNVSGGGLSVSVYGTNQLLPRSHQTISQYASVGGPSVLLAANGNHTLASGGASFPIPITSRRVHVGLNFHSGGGQSSIVARLLDVVSGIQFAAWRVSGGFGIAMESYYNGTTGTVQPNAPQQWVDLYHTQNPMYVQIDPVTGTNVVDMLITQAAA